jgi:hypothetical protein
MMDRFGAESETLTVIIPEVPQTTKTKAVVQLTCDKGFADKKQGDLYVFPMTLRDGQKVAAEHTFTASDKGMDIKFQVKLTHMP